MIASQNQTQYLCRHGCIKLNANTTETQAKNETIQPEQQKSALHLPRPKVWLFEPYRPTYNLRRGMNRCGLVRLQRATCRDGTPGTTLPFATRPRTMHRKSAYQIVICHLRILENSNHVNTSIATKPTQTPGTKRSHSLALEVWLGTWQILPQNPQMLTAGMSMWASIRVGVVVLEESDAGITHHQNCQAVQIPQWGAHHIYQCERHTHQMARPELPANLSRLHHHQRCASCVTVPGRLFQVHTQLRVAVLLGTVLGT